MFFSIIIPVYNRPDEIKELLDSLLKLDYTKEYEIVIVEDGSTIKCDQVIVEYSKKLSISYYFKSNSGPGDSRNFGMRKAKGDYFIIFDSDCIIPNNYLTEVDNALKSNYVDCFGGPDKALKSFSNIQRAINFAMTSFLTTGGIRGGSESIDKFQPRSFNMGISKVAFQKSGGFGNIHPGEDPDLSIRLWKLGFNTKLFSKAFVYHKRRIDWDKFSQQVSKFGKARPILNFWYPEYKKITYWFPTFFILGLFVSIVALFFLFDWFLKLYFLYFFIIFIASSIQNLNPYIGILSVLAVWKQFLGYGLGFLKSYYKIFIKKTKPEIAFPELFFKNDVKINNDPVIVEEKKEIFNDDSKLVEQKNIINKEQSTEKKTQIIGITGGIGSGKTTIAKYIESKGIPVYISDIEAKKVMDLPEVTSKIVKEFGFQILSKNNVLDREKLAAIVFNNQEKLKKLNAIVHPAVKNHFNLWLTKNNENPFVIKETAILFESGGYKDCKAIISVVAPLETRIQRVLKRDSTTRDKIMQRISNQISDEERINQSHFVINNENFEDTKKKVDEILNLLRKS